MRDQCEEGWLVQSRSFERGMNMNDSKQKVLLYSDGSYQALSAAVYTVIYPGDYLIVLTNEDRTAKINDSLIKMAEAVKS